MSSSNSTSQSHHSSSMTFTSLLNELSRDIIRSDPSDLLQFCSTWFQFKLEQERQQLKTIVNQQQQQLDQQQNHNNNNNYSFNHQPPNHFPLFNHPNNNNNQLYSVSSRSSNSSTIHSPTNLIRQQQQQQQQQPNQPFQHQHQQFQHQQQLSYPSPTQANNNQFQKNTPISSRAFQPSLPNFTNPSSSPQQLSNYNLNSNNSHQTPIIQSQNPPPAPAPPVIEEEEDRQSDHSFSGDDPIVPAGYNFSRRVSVSAESLSPSNRNNGPLAPKLVIPKTISQRNRIEASIKDNLLFRNLDEEQHNDVLNAMSEVRVTQGTEVIVQGAVGDFFYVVEEGTFDVYVRGPPTYTYVPPSTNRTQGTLSTTTTHNASSNLLNPFLSSNALNNQLSASSPSSSSQGTNDPNGDHLSSSPSSSSIQRSTTPFGLTGTTLTHQAPSKKVHSYGPGGSFGELALMYNAPRAATVVATSPTATLWALDRVTFRSILIEHTARKRKMYENFLSEVPILVSLSSTEISKIADSLEERSFNEGIDVVKEGEVGREFFIIESGRAEVYKKRNNKLNLAGPGESTEEELVGILGKGDHFGELALLNSAPRAATVRAAQGGGKLKVAALGEKAFTRLLGPVIDILSRHAESHYGKTANGGMSSSPSNNQVSNNSSQRDQVESSSLNGSHTLARNLSTNSLDLRPPSSPVHSPLAPSSASSLNGSVAHLGASNGHSFAGWPGLGGLNPDNVK